MVSGMESERELSQQLAEAERAEAAPWLDYPPLPRWWAPVAGAWFAAMLLVLTEAGNHLVAFPSLAVLLGIEFGFIVWYRRRWGTWPELRSAPREFRPAMRRYFVGLVLGTAAVVATYLVAGRLAAAAVTFVAATVLFHWYDLRYAAASRAARARLA
jgi:hypothetical protein